MRARITIKNVATLISMAREGDCNDVIKIDLNKIPELNDEILKSIIEIIPKCSNLEVINLSRKSDLLMRGSVIMLNDELIADLLSAIIMNSAIKVVDLQGIGIKQEHNDKLAQLSARAEMKLNLQDTKIISECGSQQRSIIASLSFLAHKAVIKHGIDIDSANIPRDQKEKLKSMQVVMDHDLDENLKNIKALMTQLKL